MAKIQPLAQLADALLDGRLAGFLSDCRSAGDSWDTIAKRLWMATDQKVSVNGVTVQAWFERMGATAPC